MIENISRKFLQWPVLVFFLWSFSDSQITQAQEPTVERMPNIILVMADDLGREAVGAYGGTSYQTPNLDRMSKTGVRFDQAYAYPLCTNTRVSLMTGKYNYRIWKAFGILDPELQTFGHLMQDQGYKTCMVGKWQLQSYDPPGYQGGELRRGTGMKVEDAGFHEYSMWHTGHTENKGSRYADPIIYQNGAFLDNTNDKYGPDLFVDYLLDFIDRHQDQPFFAYYPMALPHGPFVLSPDNPLWEDRTKRHQADKKYFKDMVEYTDKIMGQIFTKLDESGLRENTLVIFYSDNGTHQSIISDTDSGPIQGGKGLPIDAGCRVPMMVDWQGIIAPGQVSNQMIDPNDFVPTIFDAIGRALPAGFLIDGQSFLPELLGQSSNRRDWVMIEHNPRPGWDKENIMPRKFVRGDRYKLYQDGGFYDVKQDPLEQIPLEVTGVKLVDIHARYSHILDSLRKYRTFGRLISNTAQFDQVVPPYAKIEILGQGFSWLEGPVWVESQQMLLFSDVPRNIVYKWTDAGGIEVFLEKSGYTGEKPRSGGKGSNGLTLDNQGRLILCRQGDREIARLASSYQQPLPVYQALATGYQGKRFNSPNDAKMDSQGNIYFTDPAYGLDKNDPTARELDFNGVYRLNTDGSLELLIRDLPTPNGVALSPDETKLYVANSTPPQWLVYDLTKKNLGKGKVLLDGRALLEASRSGQAPDGLDVNRNGIIFAGGPDGIIVISPEGEHLGTIYTGKRTSNCVLSDDEMVLYVTCDDYLLRLVLGYAMGG